MLIIKSQETQKKSQTPTAAKPLPPPPSPLSSSDEEVVFVRKSTASKRPAEDGATKEAKKPFNFLQRIWNEEDEIVILQRMIDHKSMKKSGPTPDMYDFIREKLRFDASRVQLQRKMGRMKSRYERNKSKEAEGKLVTFSKLHDQKVYNMSEIIWGDESGNGEKAARKGANKKVEEEEDVENDAEKNVRVKVEEVKIAAAVVESRGREKLAAAEGLMSMEEKVLIAGRELYELGKDGVEREEEWQKLRVEELELYQKEMEVKVAQNKVRIAQTKLVLNAIKEGKIAIF